MSQKELLSKGLFFNMYNKDKKHEDCLLIHKNEDTIEQLLNDDKIDYIKNHLLSNIQTLNKLYYKIYHYRQQELFEQCYAKYCNENNFEAYEYSNFWLNIL